MSDLNSFSKLRRSGKSFKIDIPEPIINELGWNDGELIEIKPNGKYLILRRVNRKLDEFL